MIGVVAVERGQMERGGESGLAVREEVLEPFIRLRRRAEAGELAHGPEAAAIAGRMDAARVRELAGESDLVDVLIGDRERRGERIRLHTAERSEVFFPRWFDLGPPLLFAGAQLLQRVLGKERQLLLMR